MKKIRLYDFSIPAGFAAVIVFAFLLFFCWSRIVYSGQWAYLLLLAAVLGALGWLIWDFVLGAAVLDGEGVHSRKVSIPRDRLYLVSEYDARFKEPVYRLRDRASSYDDTMDWKALERVEVKVQATYGNSRKLEAYLQQPLLPARKPRYRWRKDS